MPQLMWSLGSSNLLVSTDSFEFFHESDYVFYKCIHQSIMSSSGRYHIWIQTGTISELKDYVITAFATRDIPHCLRESLVIEPLRLLHHLKSSQLCLVWAIQKSKPSIMLVVPEPFCVTMSCIVRLHQCQILALPLHLLKPCQIWVLLEAVTWDFKPIIWFSSGTHWYNKMFSSSLIFVF